MNAPEHMPGGGRSPSPAGTGSGDARQRLLQLRLKQRQAAAPAEVIARRAGSAPAPLSFAQEGLWFLDRMTGPSAVYNTAQAWRVRGALDIGALERALQALVDRHTSLRTAFDAQDGSARQTVWPADVAAQALRLEGADTIRSDAADRDRALEVWLEAGACAPFDLSQAPLLRARLLRLDHDEHVLQLVVHHIVSDGWSMAILTHELGALYDSDGHADGLTALPIQYADYAVWQREREASAARQQQLGYWRRQLDGLETLELPTDRPRPAQVSYRGGSERFVVPGPLRERLKTLAQGQGATLFMVLLATFQVLLMRQTRQHDVAVGVPVAGRHRAEFEGLIGYFVNSLVIRSAVPGDIGFDEYLAQVRQTALDAYAHQEVPFDQLVAALGAARDPGRHPLYQVSFALNNQPAQALRLARCQVQALARPATTAKFDLSLALAESPAGLQGDFEYCVDLFDAASIRRLADQYVRLLEAVLTQPATALARLPLLGAAERRQLLEQWNDTGTAPAQPCAVQALVEQQVRRTPQAIAARFGGAVLSYAELDARANRLAHLLRSRGVGAQTPVALCAERSLSTLVAVLAVLKSGGTYVPIDPDYPAERIGFMLADCAAPLVLTQASTRSRLTAAWVSPLRTICLDGDADEIAAQPAHGPEPLSRPEHAAYVIYTSGSTGQPKGVLIEHAAIANHLQWLAGAVRLWPSDRVLFKTSICFDASVVELLAPLVAGACIVVAPGGGERDPGELAATIRDHGVTVMQMVPSALSALLSTSSISACRGLRYLVCGGEKLDRDLARDVRRLLPDTTLGNFYGPTETCIDATWHEVVQVAPGPGTVPIGRPVSHARCHILDPWLQPVPIGVVGELYIGGAGLARGYLNRPELTAEHFVADPFRPDDRLYRSGDLARYLPDGTIECLGRADDQIKLRGFRIEVGEIEAALRQCPGVQQSAVLLREDGIGPPQLVAYVGGREAADPVALQERLAQRLPAHMLPSAIVPVPHWPLSSNGKLDRRALPLPERATPPGDHEPASTATELVLERLWCELLGLDAVGAGDDFFELGGHSLLAIRLLAEVEKAFGVALRVATVFQAPTLRQLAATIREQRSGPPTCVVPLQPHGTRPWLFAVSGYGGGIAPFKPLARELGADQPLCVLDTGVYDGSTDDFSLEDLARRMVADMRVLQPVGPYRLVGYSMGGKIVYEMAQQLVQAGQDVALLALLDCAGPNYPRRAWFGMRALLHLRHGVAQRPPDAWRYLSRRVWNLRKYVVDVRPKLFDGQAVAALSAARAMQESADAVERAWARYVPAHYPGGVLLVRAAVRPSYPGVVDDDPEMGWGPLVGGGIRLESLPCGHIQMLDRANARALAQVLEPHLDAAAAVSASTGGPAHAGG